MKKLLIYTTIALTLLLTACSKDDGTGGKGARVTNEVAARAVFQAINTLWTGTLRTIITAEQKKFQNQEVQGPKGGTAIVNGEYSTTSSSSSNSSRRSSYIDVIISFQDYQTESLKITGKLRFFDTSNSRTACSSSGCASSSHSRHAYNSEDGSKVSFGTSHLQFSTDGGMISDDILIDSGKSDNMSWYITVTNGNNEAFQFTI
ncbi:hypothetical protein SAMN05216436_11218 [bacterium A37T11]|nr:hypothetical protein SAMN05216436_11218 [bacterium A37T11]